MSVSTCPFVELGLHPALPDSRPALDMSLQILPSVSIHPMVETRLASSQAARRYDDRSSRTAKARKTEEVHLVVARSRRQQPGGRGRGGLPRLLAPQDELADWRAGIFLPGLPELRGQAVVRRAHLQRLWSIPL